MEQQLPDLMTADEVAKVLHVTAGTVIKWAKSGELRGIKVNNGRWRFYPNDVVKFLGENHS